MSADQATPDVIFFYLKDAVKREDPNRVKFYLQKPGIDINYTDEFGNAALHYGAQGRSQEVIRLLLGAGANPDVYNKDNLTPVDIARDRDESGKITKMLMAVSKPYPEDRWVKVSDDEVAHLRVSPDIHRTLTEIFNFNSLERTTIFENLKTNAEIVAPVAKFADLPEGAFKEALVRFRGLGGTVNEEVASRIAPSSKKAPENKI